MNTFFTSKQPDYHKPVINIRTASIINYNINIILLLFITSITYAQSDQSIQLANEYLLKGEKQKAIELYREVAKNDNNVALIHNNYLNALLDVGLFDEAQRYLNRITKKFADNLAYQVDMAWVYFRAGDATRAEKTIRDLIDANKHNASRAKALADFLSFRSLTEYSIQTLITARKAHGNSTLFCLELAMLYRVRGQKEQMVDEYIAYVTQDNYNLQYVKNVLQVLLEPSDMEALENKLLSYVQQYPDKEVYSDLLVWINLQQKNFYGAFIQSRAMDRRSGSQGERTAEVARLALSNGDYETARAAYQWIIRTYPQGVYYTEARRGLIETREEALRRHYPLPMDSVQRLVSDYQRFISEIKPATAAWEAQRSLALVYSRWLNNNLKAIELLKEVINNSTSTKTLVAQAKLDLGDIYLQNGEWWESTLLYSQVEKSMKETEVGYEAKLRNAKLWYFKGDFRLAADHLDVLKEATSREIANDAMELSLRIKENLTMDSSGMALKTLARVELLLQQNREQEAFNLLNQIKEGRVRLPAEEAFVSGNLASLNSTEDSVWVAFPNYAILDEVYWLEAELFAKRNEYEKSIQRLDRIINEYPNDVLADDAFFRKAEIIEKQLNQKERAQELYLEFLTRFPGSIYAAEARKRYRLLRGDFGTDQF